MLHHNIKDLHEHETQRERRMMRDNDDKCANCACAFFNSNYEGNCQGEINGGPAIISCKEFEPESSQPMTTPNRPPSCDRLNPELKECPFCGSNNVELRDGYNLDELAQYVRCNSCEADGPWSDDNIGTKWNSIPRRSEVLELIRLVDEVVSWDEAIIDTHNFPEDGLAMAHDFKKLKAYTDKLRKEIGE